MKKFLCILQILLVVVVMFACKDDAKTLDLKLTEESYKSSGYSYVVRDVDEPFFAVDSSDKSYPKILYYAEGSKGNEYVQVVKFEKKTKTATSYANRIKTTLEESGKTAEIKWYGNVVVIATTSSTNLLVFEK